MDTEKMETPETPPLTSFEKKVDRFFALPGEIGQKIVERLFHYTYRETESGVFGLFSSPEKISKAARAARDKGYTNFDCLTPFPVHGLEFDMGLTRSKLPYITFFAGLTGFLLAFFLQFLAHEQFIWTSFLQAFPNLNSYPLNIAGKPTYSWPAMVPILFELTVLLGGHTTVFGLILLAKLYRPGRKALHPDITNDRFCLWIPSDSAGYDEGEVKKFLADLGAGEITSVAPEKSTGTEER